MTKSEKSLARSVGDALKEEYIMYHRQHYLASIPRLTDRYLSPIYQEAISTVHHDSLKGQVQAIVRSMETKGKASGTALEIAEALGEGYALEEMMKEITSVLDDSISKAWASDYQDIINHAHDYDALFEAGPAKRSKPVQEFLDLVVKGIEVMTNGGVPENVFIELTKIGKKFGPKSFQYSSEGHQVATTVTYDQLRVIENILTYLSRAADKLRGEGALSAKSLQGTVTNIFSTALGEQIARQLLQQAMPNIDTMVGDIGKYIWGNNSNLKLISSDFNMTGKDKVNNKTAKVDLLNSDALQLTLSMKGSTLIIDMATNISVKWAKKKGNKVVPQISLGSISMGDILNGFSIEPRGIAYNIIGHNQDDQEGYQKLRSTISASYLNNWISGSGGLTNRGNVDKAQLLLINGKLYTITEIVEQIMHNIPYASKGATSQARMNVSFTGIHSIENSWTGNPAPNRGSAEERSRKLQAMINGLSVTALLNLT